MKKLILEMPQNFHESEFNETLKIISETNDDFNPFFEYKPEIKFSDWCSKVTDWSLGKNLPNNFVPNSFFFAIINQKIIGRVSIRHTLDENLFKRGGHIGYWILTPYRNQGYGTEILRQSLNICKTLNLDKVLLTCAVDNVASNKIIEKNMGKLEAVQDGFCRYWIKL